MFISYAVRRQPKNETMQFVACENGRNLFGLQSCECHLDIAGHTAKSVCKMIALRFAER